MMLSEIPEVSVILPVYNCERYLGQAIQSILSQTFTNFELIIINDGSTDKSGEVARSFSDPRIIYLEQTNKGLANTLNHGLRIARAELIARQDQDDISLPTRLEKQVAFLRQHDKVALLGTSARIWMNDTPTDRKLSHPLRNRELQSFLCFDNPFVHSSVMFRKDAVIKVGEYRSQKFYQPEDYDLWLRLSRSFQVANLSEDLLVYRELGTSMSRAGNDPFPNVPFMAAEQIRQRSMKIFPKRFVERFSKDIRSHAKVSRPRAVLYLVTLFCIGLRFGFTYRHFKEKLRVCKASL